MSRQKKIERNYARNRNTYRAQSVVCVLIPCGETGSNVIVIIQITYPTYLLLFGTECKSVLMTYDYRKV